MAQITFTTTPEQDARIVPAFKSILGLDHDPTAVEIKAAVVAWVRNQVQDYERRQDMAAFTPLPLDPT